MAASVHGFSRWVLVGLLSVALAACDGLTREEALMALEETALSSEASVLAGNSIEITTSFTIGQALEDAAAEIRAFIESQLPCAQVTIAGARLTVAYGVLGGTCSFHGQTFSGIQILEVQRVDEGDVRVHHEWQGFSNGRLSVTGSADVTWSNAFSDRHIVHSITWTRLSDGRSGVESGDRLQQALNDDWTQGVTIDGARSWEGEHGRFDLEIDGVEARWMDPVPQAGTCTLTTPFDGKTATLTFSRIDDDMIEAVLSSGRRNYSFRINRAGTITE